MEHVLCLSLEAESDYEFFCASECHDFVLDDVVGSFYSAILLFEGIADDAESKSDYLAVSLQRIFRPSLRA